MDRVLIDIYKKMQHMRQICDIAIDIPWGIGLRR